MPNIAADDDRPHTQATSDVVLRHHLCWRHRDLDGVMSYYHPDIQYHDFFQNRVIRYAELREYLQASTGDGAAPARSWLGCAGGHRLRRCLAWAALRRVNRGDCRLLPVPTMANWSF